VGASPCYGGNFSDIPVERDILLQALLDVLAAQTTKEYKCNVVTFY
jgi:hypothetical protein